MLIPPFIKWIRPGLQRFFKLTEIDSKTKARVSAKQYPAYFRFLYSLWIIALLSSGFIVLIWFMISGPALFPGKSYAVPVFLGLINMLGVWFIFGAILDVFFWQISSENFKDYIRLRNLKDGWGFDMKQQILTLFKMGFIYYLLTIPVMVILLII